MRLKLRHPPFETLQRQRKVAATDDDLELLRVADELLRGAWDGARPVRLLGLTAADLRDALNGDGVVFEGAGDRGDRFLYNRVYVDRTLDEVRAHFGDEMAGALDALEPHASEWQGPLASQHGWHAVLLTRKAPSRIPALAEIRSVLREEILRERREASLERGVREVLDRYAPQLADDVHAPPEPDAG